MEYHGCSLGQLMSDCAERHYRFSAVQIASWVRELVTALADLHDRYDRVHRDIKPNNILFRLAEAFHDEGPESLAGAEVVLTDFGTIAEMDSDSALLVGHDRWKDPALHPKVREEDAGDCPPHAARARWTSTPWARCCAS